MEGLSAPVRALAACVHDNLGEDQHGALAQLGTRGRRLKAYAPHGHWRTLTFIAALRHDRIDAPWVIDGPIDGETFLLYIEKFSLRPSHQGDVVVLDNLGGPREKATRAIVRAKGAHLIFLSPYSPDLNPIEQVFAKLKHLVRKAQPRNVKPPGERSANSSTSSSAECANYLVNSGFLRSEASVGSASR